MTIAETEQAACMTLLNNPEEPLMIRVVHMSQRVLTIACAADLALGEPVRIEWQSYILLAEVAKTQTPDVRILHIRHCFSNEDLTWIARLWE